MSNENPGLETNRSIRHTQTTSIKTVTMERLTKLYIHASNLIRVISKMFSFDLLTEKCKQKLSNSLHYLSQYYQHQHFRTKCPFIMQSSLRFEPFLIHVVRNLYMHSRPHTHHLSSMYRYMHQHKYPNKEDFDPLTALLCHAVHHDTILNTNF